MKESTRPFSMVWHSATSTSNTKWTKMQFIFISTPEITNNSNKYYYFVCLFIFVITFSYLHFFPWYFIAMELIWWDQVLGNHIQFFMKCHWTQNLDIIYEDSTENANFVLNWFIQAIYPFFLFSV